ncbi:MAG: hypothetical protein HYV97_09085 [Bdellovibrio sp.]|nr:hypothetical protein [Bdellovibrio sp.]
MIIRIPIQLILFLGLIMFGPLAWSQEWLGNVITDPAISKRCDDLAKKREQKLGHKQKLMALLKRNNHLQKIAPPNRRTVKLKLEINEGQLNQELDLTRLTIEQLEEGIIRKGCPGIAL